MSDNPEDLMAELQRLYALRAENDRRARERDAEISAEIKRIRGQLDRIGTPERRRDWMRRRSRSLVLAPVGLAKIVRDNPLTAAAVGVVLGGGIVIGAVIEPWGGGGVPRVAAPTQTAAPPPALTSSLPPTATPSPTGPTGGVRPPQPAGPGGGTVVAGVEPERATSTTNGESPEPGGEPPRDEPEPPVSSEEELPPGEEVCLVDLDARPIVRAQLLCR